MKILTVDDIHFPSEKLATTIALTFFCDLYRKTENNSSTQMFLQKPLTLVLYWFHRSCNFPIDDFKEQRAWIKYSSRPQGVNTYLVDALYYVMGIIVEDWGVTAVKKVSSNHYYIDITAETVWSAESEMGLKKYIHTILLANLSLILEYKIKNQEPFGNPELILQYLNEEDQKKFVFNLDLFKQAAATKIVLGV